MVRNSDGTLQINKIAATSGISNDQLIREIKEAIPRDSFAKTVMASLEEHPSFELDEGLLYFEGLVYVPSRVRELVMQRYHDGPLMGHPGVTKMLQILGAGYFFPKMRTAIEDFVRRCSICRRSKHDRHAPYGLLQPLQVPTKPWQAIAMDFIVKLPPSADPVTKESYDGIMVVTDRFTKFGRFIPYRETWTATELAHVFIKNVVANHGMPEQLVSDRDKLFTSNFWTALMQHLGVKHKMSTSYHPQTDGQTERLNQTLEQYLRCYVNDRQDNWISLLLLA